MKRLDSVVTVMIEYELQLDVMI